MNWKKDLDEQSDLVKLLIDAEMFDSADERIKYFIRSLNENPRHESLNKPYINDLQQYRKEALK